MIFMGARIFLIQNFCHGTLWHYKLSHHVFAMSQEHLRMLKKQGGPGTEPELETGTVGTVFGGTERGTGTAGTVFQEPKPEPEPSSL